MRIENCTIQDTDKIFDLYAAASAHQQLKKVVVWPQFEKAMVEKEITDNRQWKLMIDDEIACNWAITFSDPEIWGEKNKDAAVYIHRIATNPVHRGNNFVKMIVNWAKEYAKANKKDFIRLDTLGYNVKLIEHYCAAGFNFLGMFRLTDTANLPLHYQQQPDCCLFEIVI